MIGSIRGAFEQIKAWSGRVGSRLNTRRTRRAGIALLVVLVLYTLGGFFGVPRLLRHLMTTQTAASLNRRVTVGDIYFNPFSLRLELGRLHISDRDPARPFVDLGHLLVKVSWTSLFRFAPVIKELKLDRPELHIVRIGRQNFNFSDLLVSKSPPSPPGKPLRFALSNIRLRNGAVHLDDQVLGQQHAVDHLELGLPFIANLPADTAIFVRPLLSMVIDGSPLKVDARALPFAKDPESLMALRINRLNLASYIGYVPVKLPVTLPHGTLSASLWLHFVQAATGPAIRVTGQTTLDDVDVRAPADTPLVSFKQAVAHFEDLEPLSGVFHLGEVTLDGLDAQLVRNRDGTTNLTPLTKTSNQPAGGAAASPAAAPAITPAAEKTPLPSAVTANAPSANPTAVATASPAAPAPPSIAAAVTPAPPVAPRPPTAKAPLDFAMESFTLTHGTIKLNDRSLPAPANIALQNINAGLHHFALRAKPAPPAPYSFTGSLGGGGSIAIKGDLDLVNSQVSSDVTIDRIDLPALQAYAQSATTATLGSGKLNAHAAMLISFAPKQFNLHTEPATFSIDDLAVLEPDGKDKAVQWSRFGATITRMDLATRQVEVSEIHGDRIHLLVRREHDGKLSLLSMLRAQDSSSAASPGQDHSSQRPGAPPRTAAAAGRHSPPRRGRQLAAQSASTPNAGAPAPGAPAAPGWQYRISSIAINQAEIDSEDQTTARPVKASLAPLNVTVKNFSSDFAKPFDLAMDGVLNRRGNFKIAGPVAIAPMKAELKVNTRRLDLAVADSYLPHNLNAAIKSALLTTDGVASASMVRGKLRANYRGSATLGSVRTLDKLTGNEFVRWSALRFDRIDCGIGKGQPTIRVGAIDLSDFYARVILNSNGRLNLSDITSSAAEAPKSLTRAQPDAAATAMPPAAASTVPAANAAAETPKPIGADLLLGQITLHGGHVDYSDFFIKPNYRANLTDISGKVGSFGTASTAPADVLLDGQINGSAPIDITGAINPLAPLAMVDITARAKGIELTDLTAYSVKYTGYPITQGTLSVDVHYQLKNRNLSATNHIFLNQLSFGDKVESPTAMNLPMRLAVAILKDANGRINLDVPISGSLNDPQFSLGGTILHAFMNILTKAVTAPFRLLASAIGGVAGGGEDLSYVEFAPGRATLDADNRRRLDTVAAALNARSALKLSITGRIDPAADKPALRDAKVDDEVRERLNDGEDSTLTADDPMPPDLYNKYLKKVYKAAKFDKPSNVIGLNKSLPPDEMKQLLVKHMEVSADDLKHLADARAQAARKYLGTKIDPGRLFISAPKLDAGGIEDKGKPTRADLSLQ